MSMVWRLVHVCRQLFLDTDGHCLGWPLVGGHVVLCRCEMDAIALSASGNPFDDRNDVAGPPIVVKPFLTHNGC